MKQVYKLGEISLFTEDQIQDQVVKLQYKNAPKIVYERLCQELCDIMRSHPSEIPANVPEAVNIITATNILRKLYPELD